MSKMVTSPLFRALVCFLVICCFLVNLSPIRAEATSVVVPAAVLTFEGLMAALFSMSIGVVAVDLTVEAWNKIGQDLGEEIENADPSVVEAWVDVEALYNTYGPDDDGSEDELEWAAKLKTALSRGLLAFIAGWLCSIVNVGGYEVESNVTTGWTYYGEHYLPTFPSFEGFSYQLLYKDDYSYLMVYTDYPMFVHPDGGFTCANYYNYKYIQLNHSTLESWDINSTHNSANSSSDKAGDRHFSYPMVWANHDMFSYSDGTTLILAGSEPTTTKTEIIEPSIYVGDIPQQIQDGDKDKDNLNLPIIDPFKLIQSPSTALNDVNQMQQALKDGTTTLDQYLEQVQVQGSTTTDPDPTTDSSESTQPSTGTDIDEPITDIKPYGLDLKDYFPFCIPFDIYEFFSVLIAEPTAPQFHWELQDLSGNTYSIDVDLSPWDSFAAVFRRMQLLLFIVGLAAASRKFIKW